MTPDELNVRPGGSVDPDAKDHVYGGVPPDAASVCEYAIPTSPAGKDEVLTESGAVTIQV